MIVGAYKILCCLLIGQQYVVTTIQNTGLHSSIVKIFKSAYRVYCFGRCFIENSTLTSRIGSMFNKEKLLTKVNMSNCFTHP